MEFMKKNGIRFVKPSEIKEGLGEVIESLESFVRNSKVYISIDMDVFDPSFVPAVDYPEPGGISFFDFTKIVPSAFKGDVVGMDVVELLPIKERRSEFLGIKVILELLKNAGVA